MTRNIMSTFALFSTICLAVVPTAQADIIHETAYLSGTGVTVPILSLDDSYYGSRFSVYNTVEVESVGGHLRGDSGSGTLFAAIISLSSPTALPSGSPFDMTTVANTVFSAAYPSDDILVPLSVTLNPGHYALVFGSGQFALEVVAGYLIKTLTFQGGRRTSFGGGRTRSPVITGERLAARGFAL